MKPLHPWRHRKGFTLGASTSTTSRNKAAQRGIAYHKRVYKKLEAQYAQDPDAKLLVEPWFQEESGTVKRRMCSPDAVLLLPALNAAIVIEVKMNWKDGRDEKLVDLYLPVVRSAFKVDHVWPLLVTGDLRRYPGKVLLGLSQVEEAMAWETGQHTFLLLHP